jgi:hypothetical protein
LNGAYQLRTELEAAQRSVGRGGEAEELISTPQRTVSNGSSGSTPEISMLRSEFAVAARHERTSRFMMALRLLGRCLMRIVPQIRSATSRLVGYQRRGTYRDFAAPYPCGGFSVSSSISASLAFATSRIPDRLRRG